MQGVLKRDRWIRSVLVLAAATFVACAPAKRARSGGGAYPYMSTPVDVLVDNNNWEPITVYVLRGAYRHRLGIVEGKTVRTVRLPAHVVGDGLNLRLSAETRVSRESLETESFDAINARKISLRIGARFAMSWFSVF